jgi:hypothetical protein
MHLNHECIAYRLCYLVSFAYSAPRWAPGVG